CFWIRRQPHGHHCFRVLFRFYNNIRQSSRRQTNKFVSGLHLKNAMCQSITLRTTTSSFFSPTKASTAGRRLLREQHESEDPRRKQANRACFLRRLRPRLRESVCLK